MSNKEKIESRLIDALDMCKVDKQGEYLEVTFPVITSFNQQLVTLRLYPFEDYYYVSSTDTVFDEYEEYSANYCEKYYNEFVKDENLSSYEINRYGAYLYKKYDGEYSVRYAVDEFIKFFIELDKYMLRNE